MPWIRLESRRRAGMLDILLRPRQPLGEEEDLLMETNLLALAGLAGQVLGAGREELIIALPGHERPWQTAIGDQLPGTVFYGSRDFRLSVPLTRLDQACLLADDELHELMCHRCRLLEREVDQASLTGRVKKILVEQGGDPPNLAEMARRLGRSSRSLSRHLAAEGCDYRTLVDQTRRQIADQLIRHSNLPITRIAARLGYADPSNFNRAFRRWTGKSPGHWRRDSN